MASWRGTARSDRSTICAMNVGRTGLGKVVLSHAGIDRAL